MPTANVYDDHKLTWLAAKLAKGVLVAGVVVFVVVVSVDVAVIHSRNS